MATTKPRVKFKKQSRTKQAIKLKAPKRLNSINSKVKGATVAKRKGRPLNLRAARSGTKVI